MFANIFYIENYNLINRRQCTNINTRDSVIYAYISPLFIHKSLKLKPNWLTKTLYRGKKTFFLKRH